MVDQKLKEGSGSTSNFLSKTSKSSELDPETIKISNELIKSVKEAHYRYQDELEKQRKQKQESQKPLKRKIVAKEIKALKEKRVNLISEIEIDACRC